MDTFNITRVGPAHDYGYAVRDLLTQKELGVFDTKRQAEAFVQGYKEAGGFTAVELIIDLKGMLEHYVSGRPNNWDGTTKKQALAVIAEANRYLGVDVPSDELHEVR